MNLSIECQDNPTVPDLSVDPRRVRDLGIEIEPGELNVSAILAQSLCARDERVFRLVVFEEKTAKEVAEILGVSVSRIYQILNRAKKILLGAIKNKIRASAAANWERTAREKPRLLSHAFSEIPIVKRKRRYRLVPTGEYYDFFENRPVSEAQFKESTVYAAKVISKKYGVVLGNLRFWTKDDDGVLKRYAEAEILKPVGGLVRLPAASVFDAQPERVAS